MKTNYVLHIHDEEAPGAYFNMSAFASLEEAIEEAKEEKAAWYITKNTYEIGEIYEFIGNCDDYCIDPYAQWLVEGIHYEDEWCIDHIDSEGYVVGETFLRRDLTELTSDIVARSENQRYD